MMYDEDNDLLRPTTFKEKVKEKIPDAFYFGLMILTFTFVIFGNKNNQADANIATQKVERIQEVKQKNTALFNDSIKQNIR